MSPTNGDGFTAYPHAENKTKPYYISCRKINSKWIKDLNVDIKLKPPKTKRRRKLDGFGFVNNLLNMT